MGKHSLPSAPEAKPNAKGHIQHANPKDGQEEKKGDNALDGNGATLSVDRHLGVSADQSQTHIPTWGESGDQHGRQIR